MKPRKLYFDVYKESVKTGRIEIEGITLKKNECYLDLSKHPYPFMIYPFYYATNAIWVMDILKERVMPPNRANLREVLDALDMEEYDPIEIVRRTHGVNPNDFFWFKFDDIPDDQLTWDDLNPRKW